MTNMKLSDLLKSDLLTDKTKASVLKAGKMNTKVKASVIKQLEHKYSSVEYIKGSKWKEPSFNLGDPLYVTSNYKANVGRPELDLTDETELIKEAIYRNGAKPITKRNLVFLALGLNRKKTSSVVSAYFKNGHNKLKDTNEQVYELQQLERAVEYRITYRTNQLIGRLEKIIKKTSVAFIYKNSRHEEISKEEYQEAQKLHRQVSEVNRGILSLANLKDKVESEMNDKYGYKYVYEEVIFLSYEDFSTAKGNLVKCKKNLYDRLMESTANEQGKDKENNLDFIWDQLRSNNQIESFMNSFLEAWVFGIEYTSNETKDFMDSLSNLLEGTWVKKINFDGTTFKENRRARAYKNLLGVNTL